MKRLLSGILICAGMAGAVLLGGCVQTPQKPDIREGAAISPITAVFFPDDCTDFTGARLPTVQELRVSEENTAYTAVDGVIFTKDLETLVAFPAGRDGTYAVPDGTKKSPPSHLQTAASRRFISPTALRQSGTERSTAVWR